MYTTLISAQQLQDRLAIGEAAENTVIVDCRFSLFDTKAGYEQYRQAHLPDARYANLDKDLSSPIIAGKSSRHPLTTQDEFIQCLRRWGVNEDSQVVVYDDAGGAIAARTWWMCLWVGHQACAVLNGGIQSWSALSLPLSAKLPEPQPGTISIKPSLAPLVEVEQVLQGNRLLIDARSADRYAGESEPLDKVAGHIPGALNLPYADNLQENGEFLPATELHKRFAKALTSKPQTQVTHYCGSGVTAALNILAMLHAGLGMSALYAGSWSEWVQDSDRPIAQSPPAD